jgi:hypothetical protein
MPYTYEKRDVVWHTMIATPNEAARLFRESIFPAMLVRSIAENIHQEFDEKTRESIAQQIADDGFQVYDFYGEDSE